MRLIEGSLSYILTWHFFCVLFLMLVHGFAPKIRHIGRIRGGAVSALGAGFALSYVFLHAFPGLIESVMNLEKMGLFGMFTSYKQFLFLVFFFALLGFTLLYAIDKVAHEYGETGQIATKLLYRSQISLLVYLSFSIAVVLPNFAKESLSSLLFFTFVSSLHFIFEDYALSHHYPKHFANHGRVWTIGGLAAGTVFGLFVFNKPEAALLIVMMKAFFIGVLVMVTMREEFSFLSQKVFPFRALLFGVAIKGLLIFMILMLES